MKGEISLHGVREITVGRHNPGVGIGWREVTFVDDCGGVFTVNAFGKPSVAFEGHKDIGLPE